MENNEFQKAYSKIIAKAWSDPQFKERLLKNPQNVLSDEGIPLSKGKKITICENTDSQIYLILPQKPTGELTEQELESISGGEKPWWEYHIETGRPTSSCR